MQPPTAGGASRRPFSAWREEVKRAWRELRGPHRSPGRAAASVAVGLFVGSIPVFGCHTPVVVGLCVWLRLDAALAWIVSNVSNPLFAPALLTAEVQIGAWLRTGSALRLEHGVTPASALRQFVGYMFVGAPVAGLALATAGAVAAYAVVRLTPGRSAREPYRLPDDAPPWFHAVERVATRFADPASPLARERTRFHALRAKLLADPVAKLVADAARAAPNGLGALLDVGTGRGQLPILLLELGLASSARCIDWDERKIAEGVHAVGPRGGDTPSLPVVFTACDVRRAAFEPADTVLLIDVLHYLAAGEQDALLDRAAAAVRPGGRLVLREADADRGWRTAATLAEERFFRFVRRHRGERIVFRRASELAARLEARGLRCAIQPAWGSTPFSNVLLVGERPAAGASPPALDRPRL